MNKEQLVEAVARELGDEVSEGDVEEVIDTALAAVATALRRQEPVQLVGFGTFEPRRPGSAQEVARETPAVYALRHESSESFVHLVDALAPERVPTPSFVEQARRNAELRQAILTEFGALDARGVHRLAGSRSRNTRQTASRWRAEGLLFAVEHRGRTLYPGFQFDADRQRPKAAVAEILRALPPAMRGWEIASWWTEPNDALRGVRPVDLVDDDPDSVIAAAVEEAREWALSAGADPARPA